MACWREAQQWRRLNRPGGRHQSSPGRHAHIGFQTSAINDTAMNTNLYCDGCRQITTEPHFLPSPNGGVHLWPMLCKRCMETRPQSLTHLPPDVVDHMASIPTCERDHEGATQLGHLHISTWRSGKVTREWHPGGRIVWAGADDSWHVKLNSLFERCRLWLSDHLLH